MNHNNFHFTEILDKTNDNFLKKSKNHVFGPFLTIFGHFCHMAIFSKQSASVTHNYIWAPNTMLSFKKKLMSKSWENLRTDGRADRRMEGWTDGQTLFYRALPAKTQGPKNICTCNSTGKTLFIKFDRSSAKMLPASTGLNELLIG